MCGAGLAFAADPQGQLIEHGAHLGQELGQGLGDVGRAKHRAAELLELHVEIGIAGGAAGHRLAQRLELGLGALEAGGLGLVQRAALLQAGHGLQGEEQEEAEGGRHSQLAAEAGATFELRIMGPQLGGDLEQRQSEQGEGGSVWRLTQQSPAMGRAVMQICAAIRLQATGAMVRRCGGAGGDSSKRRPLRRAAEGGLELTQRDFLEPVVSCLLYQQESRCQSGQS